jgi:prolyl-tRNA synthetase
LRIEIGPRDFREGKVILVRRDTKEKISIKHEELIDNVNRTLEQIQKNLFDKARKFLNEHTEKIQNYEQFKDVLAKKGGFLKACWCSKQECEDRIKDETGATIRAILLEKEPIWSNCVYCGNKSNQVAYFARAY